MLLPAKPFSDKGILDSVLLSMIEIRIDNSVRFKSVALCFRRVKGTMDYDQTDIAKSYDSGRRLEPGTLTLWLNLISTYAAQDKVARIVDLGCGTGRFTEPLAGHFGAEVVGVDPSAKMLAQARQSQTDDRVTYRQAHGEELPIDDGFADLIFMSMIFHHLQDPERTGRECYRVLRDNGLVCLRNATADAIDTFRYLEFFPSARLLMAEQLPTRSQIRQIFEKYGFRFVTNEIVATEVSESWSDYAARLSLRADSFLAQIPDNDFCRGLSALEKYAQNTDQDCPVSEDVDFFVFQRRPTHAV